AVCLARTLGGHQLAVEDLAARYVTWAEHAFDIGHQTAAALDRIATGTPASRSGHDEWIASGRRAAGNGSLMRTAPIGVALADAPSAAVVEAALADSLITHADPRCALACAAFDGAIAHACRGGSDLVGAARAALATAEAQLTARWSGRDDQDAVVA